MRSQRLVPQVGSKHDPTPSSKHYSHYLSNAECQEQHVQLLAGSAAPHCWNVSSTAA
jgi:hypothetical protein